MSGATEDSYASWRQLENEWRDAHAKWNDSTADYFEAQYWGNLERETEAYQRAMESLIETLRAAQDVA